jgi:hypothetical protein
MKNDFRFTIDACLPQAGFNYYRHFACLAASKDDPLKAGGEIFTICSKDFSLRSK